MLELIGCASFAFGPPLSLFVFTVVHDPIRTIILIASAFYWLLALLISSLLTFLIIPPGDPLEAILPVILSVILQEVFRYLIYKTLQKAETGLRKVYSLNSRNLDIGNNKKALSYVSGLGFGIMSGAFSLVNLLAELSGGGTAGFLGTPHYFCLVSSIFTLCFILLNTGWSIIFFSALEREDCWKVFWVVGSHLFVSMVSILNMSYQYEISLPSTIFVLIVNSYVAYSVFTESKNIFSKFIICSTSLRSQEVETSNL